MKHWPRPRVPLSTAPSPVARPVGTAEAAPSHPSWSAHRLALPAGIAVVPARAAFADLYLDAELPLVRAGLAALQEAPGRPVAESVDALLAQQLPGAWVSLFDLKLPPLADGVAVRLHALTPALYCVSYDATPSEPFRASFARILAESTDAASRAARIDELFLSLNAALVARLRERVGCGAAQAGPLAAVEVFLVEKAESARPLTDPDQEGFWRSLDLPQRTGLHYKHDGVTAHGLPWTTEAPLYPRFRATVDGARVAAVTAAETSVTKEEAVALQLSTAPGWTNLVALFAVLSRLRGLELETRALAEASFWGRAGKLTELRLLHERLVSETFDAQGRLLLSHALSGFVSGKTTLGDDWAAEARKRVDSTRRVLEILRDAWLPA